MGFGAGIPAKAFDAAIAAFQQAAKQGLDKRPLVHGGEPSEGQQEQTG